jgi:hypothetical protein
LSSSADGHTEGSNIDQLRKFLHDLSGPFQLKSAQETNEVEIDIDDMARETAVNVRYLTAYTLLASGNLLILAFELMKEIGKTDRNPVCEFLRHCRNAAAHGGWFQFKGKEPTRPALWGRFAVNREMQQTPLFLRLDGRGLLGPWDPIRMLWDIEQQYPDLFPPERVYEDLFST